jgi:MazG family protein
MERLRGPEGCPWDREQKMSDLRTYIVEEAYELTDAITSGDMAKVREEAGDLLLQIVFLSAIASGEESSKAFCIEDVVRALCGKLIRRHPHVFGAPGEGAGVDSEQVLRDWERIKREERQDKKEDVSLLAGLPKGLPPLLRAHRVQGKAAHVGFDWPKGDLGPLFGKLDEEVGELKRAALAKDGDVEDELGDLLFMTVNLARHLDVNPDAALSRACEKFTGRFRIVEQEVAASGRQMSACSLEELDALWDEAKKAKKQ